jgi:hypothetical protein
MFRKSDLPMHQDVFYIDELAPSIFNLKLKLDPVPAKEDKLALKRHAFREELMQYVTEVSEIVTTCRTVSKQLIEKFSTLGYKSRKALIHDYKDLFHISEHSTNEFSLTLKSEHRHLPFNNPVAPHHSHEFKTEPPNTFEGVT